ncbi:2-methoxy-6-polyprenyl-1,4-benzoquinol methylase [subsurface metagenome]
MTTLKAAIKVLNCFRLFLFLIVFRVVSKFWHFPAPAFIGPFLDSDIRRRLQPPDKVIKRSGIKQGMRLLELGCGSGAFTTSVAKAVGEQGKIYAVDIQPAMLKQLERKLARPENRDLTNIELIQASAYELPFEEDSLDLAYLVTVFHEIPDRDRALREIKRILKPDGILAITEFLLDTDYRPASAVIQRCQRGGFILNENSGNLWNYTVRFKKPSSGIATN